MSSRSPFLEAGRAAALLLAASCAVARATAAPPAPSASPSAGLETVNVHLLELRVLAVDAAGRPVRDLRPDELTLTEGGAPRTLAFVEQAMSRAHDPLWAGGAPPVATLHRADERSAPDLAAAPVAVAPPPPARHIVFAFDLRNSRIPVRARWRDAARAWLDDAMRPDDRVSLVRLGGYADWLVSASRDRALLASAADGIVSTDGFPDRDRDGDMSRLVELMRTHCEPQRSKTASAEADCAARAARPLAAEWEGQARETIGALREVVGELAAVPGVKLVILFSEGLVTTPGATVFAAMQSVLGFDKVPMSDQWSMRGDLSLELAHLVADARTAGVTFQTIDSRTPRATGDASSNLEFGSALGRNLGGADPWAELYDVTRDALVTVAHETGGRYFAGKQELALAVGEAADALEGLYAVGFYRRSGDEPGRLKLRCTRRGVTLVAQRAADPQRRTLQPLRLDVQVGRPEARPDGLYAVPLALVFPLASLPLRAGEGDAQGCVVGVFVQALEQGGRIASERFELATVMTGRPREAWAHTMSRHSASIEVPAGAYRLRVRVSDDRLRVIGDRIVDLTVSGDGVTPGLAAR